MTRAPSKRQPLDKTIVTTFEVQLADVFLRKRALTGSIAKRVSSQTDFSSGDVNAGPLRAFRIENIQTAVIIQSFRDLILTVGYKDGTVVDVPCSGLFVFYGKLDFVEVKSIEDTRFSYAYS